MNNKDSIDIDNNEDLINANKNRTFNLGKIKINDTSPVTIITEIGINHAGSLNEAYKLVDLAKKWIKNYKSTNSYSR